MIGSRVRLNVMLRKWWRVVVAVRGVRHGRKHRVMHFGGDGGRRCLGIHVNESVIHSSCGPGIIWVTLLRPNNEAKLGCSYHLDLNCRLRGSCDVYIRSPCLSVYNFYKHDRRIRSPCEHTRHRVYKVAQVKLWFTIRNRCDLPRTFAPNLITPGSGLISEQF